MRDRTMMAKVEVEGKVANHHRLTVHRKFGLHTTSNVLGIRTRSYVKQNTKQVRTKRGRKDNVGYAKKKVREKPKRRRS